MARTDGEILASFETAMRLSRLYEEAMQEFGLTKEEVEEVRLNVVRRQLKELLPN